MPPSYSRQKQKQVFFFKFRTWIFIFYIFLWSSTSIKMLLFLHRVSSNLQTFALCMSTNMTIQIFCFTICVIIKLYEKKNRDEKIVSRSVSSMLFISSKWCINRSASPINLHVTNLWINILSPNITNESEIGKIYKERNILLLSAAGALSWTAERVKKTFIQNE